MVVEKDALVRYGDLVQKSELRAGHGPINGRVFAAPWGWSTGTAASSARTMRLTSCLRRRL